jgi:GxxExxY protein
MNEIIEDEVTYNIIGCAMKVHSVLGNGFQEIIYQRALAIELNKKGIKFERELSMPLHYEGLYIGKRRVDFLIQDSVMVEIKAVANLEDVHLAQGLNYLVAYKVDRGLLLNFGSRSLEIKRLRHPKNKHPLHKM